MVSSSFESIPILVMLLPSMLTLLTDMENPRQHSSQPVNSSLNLQDSASMQRGPRLTWLSSLPGLPRLWTWIAFWNSLSLNLRNVSGLPVLSLPRLYSPWLSRNSTLLKDLLPLGSGPAIPKCQFTRRPSLNRSSAPESNSTSWSISQQ